MYRRQSVKKIPNSGGHLAARPGTLRRGDGHAASLSELSTRDIGGVLLRSLADRWQVFAGQAARSRRRPSERAIHDLRVSTRRLIATLEIVRTLLPGDSPSRIRRQLKRHLKAFSDLRDLQVQMISVRRLCTRFPALRPFAHLLLGREKLLLKHARQEIRGMRMQTMERALASVENQLEIPLADPLMRDASHTIAIGALGRTYWRAATLRAGAMSGKTSRIHRFRIAFKRFRYAVEALQPLLLGVDRRMLKAMNGYQTRMGNVQDIAVLIASVNAFARRHGRSAPVQFLRLKEHLMARRKSLIEEFITAADELDSFWHRLSPSGSRRI